MTSDKQKQIGLTDRRSARFRHAEKVKATLILAFNVGIVDAKGVALLLKISEKTAKNFLYKLAAKKLIVKQDDGLFGFPFFRITSAGIEKITGELPEYLTDAEPPFLKNQQSDRNSAHDLLATLAALELGEAYAKGGDFYFVSERVLRRGGTHNWHDSWGNFYPDMLLFVMTPEGEKFKVAIEQQQQRESDFRLNNRLKHYAWAATKTEFAALEIVSTVPNISKKYIQNRTVDFSEYSDYNQGWFDRDHSKIEVRKEDDEEATLRVTGDKNASLTIYATSLSHHHKHYYG